MHASAMATGELFFKTYWRPDFNRILDIGSLDVNGSLRTFCPSGAEYIGVDLTPGNGVDVVSADPYKLPFPDQHFDCIVSTSCFEHDDMFWLTFLECARLLTDRGFLYVNAPSNGPYHGYPGDNWRFFPDASIALLKWSVRNGVNMSLVESFADRTNPDSWIDYIMVFSKTPYLQGRLISDAMPGARFIRKARLEIVKDRDAA